MAFASIQDLQLIIAQSFFGGDTGIAGIVMYSMVMAFVFLIFARNKLMVAFALMLPITLVFTSMRILPETLTILLVIISIIGIARELRTTLAE